VTSSTGPVLPTVPIIWGRTDNLWRSLNREGRHPEIVVPGLTGDRQARAFQCNALPGFVSTAPRHRGFGRAAARRVTEVLRLVTAMRRRQRGYRPGHRQRLTKSDVKGQTPAGDSGSPWQRPCNVCAVFRTGSLLDDGRARTRRRPWRGCRDDLAVAARPLIFNTDWPNARAR